MAKLPFKCQLDKLGLFDKPVFVTYFPFSFFKCCSRSNPTDFWLLQDGSILLRLR